ncbi:MAG: hypothetical protein H0W68_07535, partial [Gemmatimonadaceae bacterium]|nr:hypothetical protein [Gemmatimonadaceae bacterium]
MIRRIICTATCTYALVAIRRRMLGTEYAAVCASNACATVSALASDMYRTTRPIANFGQLFVLRSITGIKMFIGVTPVVAMP